MKTIKSILAIACCALLLGSLVTAQAEAAAPVTARFSLYDMLVNYVYVSATQEEAEAVFGAPESTESTTSEATGETSEIWYYTGLQLTFSGDGALIGADVNAGPYVGPRGIALGQTAQEVADKFYMDPASSSETVLYSAGYVEALDAQMPPSGFLQANDDGTYSINYVAPSAPFSDDMLADPTNFVYESLATLTVYFGKDDTVTEFAWKLGAWAE
jgi:hypothetical protein